MDKIENIKLNFVCDQKWESFKKDGDNRFCSQCSKTIIDFTDKSKTELEAELRKSNGEVCGRFATHQTVYKSTTWFSKTLSSILLTLGINAINNSVHAQSDIDTNYIVSPIPDTQKDSVKDFPTNFYVGMIDEVPTYKNGGGEGMLKFIQNNIIYPKDLDTSGTVYVSLTVDKLGKVINPTIIKSLNKQADEEVLRVVKLLEFIPSKRFDKPIQTNMVLPIRFSLTDKKKLDK